MNTTGEFLNEGAKSYLDALAAIVGFEEKVRSICKEVYKKYRSQLVSTMGLEDAQCREDDLTKEPENRFAELGVCQDSASGRETLYIYLMWDGAKNGAPEISACVCLEFSKKSDRNDYAKLLRRIP